MSPAPAITPATGMPVDTVDAIPPVGSRGLPLTLVFNDSIKDNIADAQATRMALFDEAIWTPRTTQATTASGTTINPKAVCPSATNLAKDEWPIVDPTGLNQEARATGLRINTSAPVMSHTRGSLLFGQIGQDVSMGRWDATQLTGSAQFAGLSITECGQYTDHPDQRYASPRPANHSWMKESDSNTGEYRTQYDFIYGTTVAKSSIGLCTEPTFIGGGIVEAIVHDSIPAIPSNGIGMIYHDAHNSNYLTTVVSAPIESTMTTAAGIQFDADAFDFSAHWSVNMRTQQPFLLTGKDISSPDGMTGAITMGATDVAEAVSEWSLAGGSTIQQILTNDVFDDGTGATPLTATNLGRADLGASVVADSVGLIGYEGVITATAFFAPTKATDTGGVLGPVSIADASKGYAGLNIQVNSGTPVRRNGYTTGTPTQPAYLYGSDGGRIDPMFDALSTHAGRAATHPLGVDVNANATWFRNFSSGDLHTSAIPDQPTMVGPLGRVPHQLVNSNQIKQGGAGTTGKIIGSNTKGDDSPELIDSTYSTGRWIADGVPTKVQIVPVITGYTDIEVSAGAAKLANHPSAASQTFRKPLVDYHVIVSVVRESHVPDGTADTSVGNTPTGTPTQRNNPDGTRLSVNCDFSDIPCTIYHGIFRIDPTSLEQIFIDATAGAALGIDPLENECPMSVMPRHTWADIEEGEAHMGWGLHQATPFRPLALADTNTKIPDLCAAVEGGGSFQRGGISHVWDACEYKGEIFIGADVIDPTQLCQTSTTVDGQPHYGIWGNGQVWPDGVGTPTIPQGCELLVWRYSPTLDPLYTRSSTYLSNPILSGFPSSGVSIPYSAATCDSITRTQIGELTNTPLGYGAVWSIHDWVMPQIEMMRYLGREEKNAVKHPKASGGSAPIYHPTLHCSSLRAMDDGRFVMAAVHVDYIKTENDYPAVDIKYPLNPDLDTGGCPAGYYQSGGKCIPIGGESADYPAGFGPDPQSGDAKPSSSVPTPVNGSGGSTPKSDNFSAYPTWSKLMANTQARSLILMFSDAKADPDTGFAKRGRALFDITWEKVSIGTGGTIENIARQTWTDGDTWWSGARISYWYQESGQRAIPITYGSYPDCRMSYANLPRSLPFLINEYGTPALSDSARISSGFPTIQPIITAKSMSKATPDLVDNDTRITDAWVGIRNSHVKLTRFVPTTIGFADFGSGANPFQELGWSGWSFPRGLFDPISYGDNQTFFSDAPESLDASPLVGGVITPTEQAIFKGFGDVADDSDSAGANLWAPNVGRFVDLRGVSFPTTLDSMIVYKLGTGPHERIFAPVSVSSVADIVAAILDPLLSDWSTIYESQYQASDGRALREEPTNYLVRTWDPNLPPPLEAIGAMEWTSLTVGGRVFSWGSAEVQGHRLMRGRVGGWSHHGPLHYGISTKMHPYRVDRVFKQVHGGVGYNIPIHLLIPPAVSVRARAGGKNAIELEMETPFHRTDNIHLLGASQFNTGFELGGESPPDAARPVAGQYFLRTNLWDKPTWGSGGVSGAQIAPMDTIGTRVHGPIVSGSFGLEAFWSDHPTDHFHASAMPILPNSDYDLAMIESSRYSPLMLARVNEIHELDVLALSEQLQSSVDVHVSQTAKPMWDSGSIASAVGMGFQDPKGVYMIQRQSNMDGNDMSGPAVMAGGSGPQNLGMGQRQLRTPDGTLHQFFIRRSCQSGSDNLPQWTHIKKPLHGDLFWNKKAMKPQNESAVFGGLDEVGPLLNSIGAGLTTPAEYHKGRVMGAAFASDSAGTIHAILEYHANPDDTANHRAHRFYYHKAVRTSPSQNPDPIYDWDWSIHTPVLLQGGATYTGLEAGGTMWDMRHPSLVIDGNDRLHLSFVQPMSHVGSTGLPQNNRIYYTSKLAGEDSFPTFTPIDNAELQGRPDDNRYQVVNGLIVDAAETDLNQPASGPHYTTYNDCPKVVLRGDNIPVVFYRGLPIQSFADASRNYDAIYCNIGQSPNRISDPSGRFAFDTTKCFHVVGLPPDSKNPMETKDVVYYDAIIDERDRAIVLSIKDDRESSPVAYAPRQTLISVFDTRKTLAEQYTSTDGLGAHITLWRGPVYDGVSELRKTNPNYRDISLTTDGKGNIHIVMSFTMIGSDDGRFGEVYRDATVPKARQSALSPLIWAATPTGDETAASEVPYIGGFIKPAESPNWTKSITPPITPYMDSSVGSEHQHLVHCWVPSIEFDTTANTLRSVNIRWLSVPSLRWDEVNNTWSPVGSAQTMAGEEDFPHHSPQLRFQRFWGYDASEIDLRWFTNELAWYRTNTKGAEVFYPSAGGIQMELGTSIDGGGEGLAGYPEG